MVYITTTRTAVNAEGDIVAETDPAAVALLYPAGTVLSDAVAEKLGLADAEKAIGPVDEAGTGTLASVPAHVQQAMADAHSKPMHPFGLTSTQPLGNTGVVPADTVEPRIVTQAWDDVSNGEDGIAPSGGRLTNERRRRDASLPPTKEAVKAAKADAKSEK